MRLFISSLSGIDSGVTPPDLGDTVLNSQLFTGVKTVAPAEGINDMMYAGVFKKNGILYTTYVEKPNGHDYYDGIGYVRTSADNGNIWSAKQQIYDPVHLLVDNGTDPVLSYAELYDVMTEAEVIQYGIDNPTVDTTILTDARDTRCSISPDGNSLIFMCFVAIGFNNGASRIKVSNNACVSVKVPINGNGSLDIANKVVVIVEHTNSAFSGGYLVLPNGDFLYCTYNSAPSAERYVKIFRSTDNGSTYLYDSLMFPDALNGSIDRNAGTEISLSLGKIGGADYIFGAARPTKQTEPFVNIIARSPFDATTGTWLAWTYNNQSWAAWTESIDNLGYILRSNGLSIATMPSPDDNLTALFGRFDPTVVIIDMETQDYIDNSSLSWSTSGYGTITYLGVDESGNHIYIIVYYKTDIIECRQLMWNATIKKLEYII